MEIEGDLSEDQLSHLREIHTTAPPERAAAAKRTVPAEVKQA